MYPAWLNEELIWWVTASSVLVGIGSTLALPAILLAIPADYFAEEIRVSKQHRGRTLLLWLFRNIFGALLVIIGIAMLVLPGQGLLTIFAGLICMEFPGKYRLERYIITKGPVLELTNRLRAWGGKDAIVVRRTS